MKGASIRDWLLSNPIVLLLAGIVLVFGMLTDGFLTWSNMVNILIQASALIIVACGMTFVLITAGIDLSVGAIMFVAGVVSGLLIVDGLALGWAIAVVLICGLVFGAINAFFIVRVGIIPFVVTLATLYVGRGFGLHLSKTRAVNLPERFLDVGSSSWLGIPLPILIMIIIVLLLHLVLTYTRFGRHLYAVGEDAEKATRAGIQSPRILTIAYLICGFCAALGGFVAIAQLGAISPSFGLQNEFMAIAAAVLGGTSLFGGVGKILPGTVIGAILIQMIQNGLVIMNADPYIYPLVTGSLIFLIVLVDSRKNLRRQKLYRKP